MAQGRNSLKFIAMMARRGWEDGPILVMYSHALVKNHLQSNKEERWLQSEEWYINGNRTCE